MLIGWWVYRVVCSTETFGFPMRVLYDEGGSPALGKERDECWSCWKVQLHHRCNEYSIILAW